MYYINGMGFGLPAENAAIKHGVHPDKWTMNNIAEIESN